MAKGQACPKCGENKLQPEGMYRECSDCHTIAWYWHEQGSEPGAGQGKHCPGCQLQTLHRACDVGEEHELHRCSTCNYTALFTK